MDLLDKYLLNILCGRLWRDFGWRVTEAQRRPGSQEHGLQDRSQMFYREAHLILKYRLTYLTFMHSLVPLCPPSWKTEYKYGTTGRRLGFSGDSEGKKSACNAGDLSSIPGSGRYPGERNANYKSRTIEKRWNSLGEMSVMYFILRRKIRSIFDQMSPEI